MKELIIQVKESRYRLFLAFLKTLDYVQVATSSDKKTETNSNYDFSDLVGKLEWRGNAVNEQRLLRDEW